MNITHRIDRDTEAPWAALVAAYGRGVIIPAQRVVGLLTYEDERRLRDDGVVITDDNRSQYVKSCSVFNVADAADGPLATDARNTVILESGVVQTWRGD